MPSLMQLHRKSSGVYIAFVRGHRWPNGTVSDVSVESLDATAAMSRLRAKLSEHSDPSIWKPESLPSNPNLSC